MTFNKDLDKFKLSSTLYLLGCIFGIITYYIVSFLHFNVSNGTENLIFTGSGDFFNDNIIIFTRNLFVCFILIYGGYLIIVPFLVLFFNGFLLGYVLSGGVNYIGYIETFIYSLHLFFELPALIISGSIGVKIGIKEAKYYFSRTELDNGLRVELGKTKKNFSLILVLIILGTIIESILLYSI